MTKRSAFIVQFSPFGTDLRIALVQRPSSSSMLASMRCPTPPHTSRSGMSRSPLSPTSRTGMKPK